MSTTIDNSRRTNSTVDVEPDLVAEWLAAGDSVLVDVREDFEHAEERIDGAVHMPLSKLDPEGLRARHAGKRIIFHCRSGQRAAQAASRYCRDGERAFCLAGGIEGWKSDGRPVNCPAKSTRVPIMRQVQITAGGLVALGVALGITVSPWFLALSAFVGCGLMVAGITGWCGMALLLGRMPWNREPMGSISSVNRQTEPTKTPLSGAHR